MTFRQSGGPVIGRDVFPRTMREAFPADGYPAIEVSPPVRRFGDRVVLAVAAAGAVVLLILALA